MRHVEELDARWINNGPNRSFNHRLFFFFAPKINLVLTARKLTNTGSKKKERKLKNPLRWGAWFYYRFVLLQDPVVLVALEYIYIYVEFSTELDYWHFLRAWRNTLCCFALLSFLINDFFKWKEHAGSSRSRHAHLLGCAPIANTCRVGCTRSSKSLEKSCCCCCEFQRL